MSMTADETNLITDEAGGDVGEVGLCLLNIGGAAVDVYVGGRAVRRNDGLGSKIDDMREAPGRQVGMVERWGSTREDGRMW